MDRVTQCILCAVMAFGPVESSLPAANGRSLPTDHFALYAAQGFPVWTWHSLQPLTVENQYPWPYKSQPQGLETPQDLLPVPKWEGLTTTQDAGTLGLQVPHQAFFLTPFGSYSR